MDLAKQTEDLSAIEKAIVYMCIFMGAMSTTYLYDAALFKLQKNFLYVSCILGMIIVSAVFCIYMIIWWSIEMCYSFYVLSIFIGIYIYQLLNLIRKAFEKLRIAYKNKVSINLFDNTDNKAAVFNIEESKAEENKLNASESNILTESNIDKTTDIKVLALTDKNMLQK